jgi:hypothetical protein
MPHPPEIVRAGTFLYDGTVVCDVQIVQAPFRPGSGDDEDLPDHRDDQPGPWFHIRYGSTTQRGHFGAGGGYHRTVAEAEAEVHRQVGAVEWSD